MEFSQDQIAAVVGSQQLEIISLRMEIQRLNEELKKVQQPKPADVLPITGEK